MKLFVVSIEAVTEWVARVFSFLMVAASLLIVIEATRRYVFDSPTIYGLEMTIFLCAVTYLMGGAYALKLGAHVRVDILYNRWSPRTKAIIDLVSAPLFFGSVGAMFWFGADWAIKAIVGGNTTESVWAPTIWPVRMAIPVGCLLLMLQGIVTSIRDFETARTGRRP